MKSRTRHLHFSRRACACARVGSVFHHHHRIQHIKIQHIYTQQEVSCERVLPLVMCCSLSLRRGACVMLKRLAEMSTHISDALNISCDKTRGQNKNDESSWHGSRAKFIFCHFFEPFFQYIAWRVWNAFQETWPLPVMIYIYIHTAAAHFDL